MTLSPAFKDQVAVITGGASGIGLATAQEFARQGASIAVLDMDRQAMATLVEQIPGPLLSIPCDITDPTAVQAAMDTIITHYGRMDLLFNNAGITQRGLFRNTDLSVFRQVMEVNFFGSLYCTKAALPALIRNKGTIVVNESIAGIAPLVGRTGYSASKHALNGLFTTLRCELRNTGVHVMVVCPGFIRTNLQKRALGPDGAIASHPQTRVGSEDTADHVAEQIATGVLKKKPTLVLTPMGRLGYYIHRLWPDLYERIMTHQFKTELKGDK